MGSRSKPRAARATSPGRTRPRGKARPEVLTFTVAFWDQVRDRAHRVSHETDYAIRKNRRKRGAPSPYRVKVAQAIAGLAVFS